MSGKVKSKQELKKNPQSKESEKRKAKAKVPAGADKNHNERIFNYKVSSEETREIEIRGIHFLAKFYKTTTNSTGIRVSLVNNGPLFDKFLEYCIEIKEERIDKEIEKNLIAFTTFGNQDKGLEFFLVMGFYVYPFLEPNKTPFLVFNQEKDAPEPLKRLEAFIDYYRKKLGIKVRPKKSAFDSLRSLDLTEI